MLQPLITQVLTDMGTPSDVLSSQTDILTRAIKDMAKEYFFKGKIGALSDWILGNETPTNEKTNRDVITYLSPYMDSSDVFLSKLVQSIQREMDVRALPRNINTLLDILGYGHLEGMLFMFNIK